MPRKKSGNVRINLFLQPQVVAALKKLASIKGTSYSELVRTACRDYVLREAATEQARRAQASEPVRDTA